MFSTHVLVEQKVLMSGQTVVRHSDTVGLVQHYHCLNTSCVGFLEDTGISAAIFPSDTKYLSEATLVEFLQVFR